MSLKPNNELYFNIKTCLNVVIDQVVVFAKALYSFTDRRRFESGKPLLTEIMIYYN